MKTLWMVAALAIAGCAGTDNVIAPPSALSIGDSVSIQYTGKARTNLCGKVVLQHEAGSIENNKPADVDDCIKNPRQENVVNDGCSSAMVANVPGELGDWHYNVIIFNAGIHDIQRVPVLWKRPNGVFYRCGSLPLDQYRENIDTIAYILQPHADIVIWIDTVPLTDGAREDQSVFYDNAHIPYNEVAEEVAKSHGFYILSLRDVQQKPMNVHLTGEGSDRVGAEVANCILTALQGQQSQYCHK